MKKFLFYMIATTAMIVSAFVALELLYKKAIRDM